MPLHHKDTVPCIDCGRPVYVAFQRCGNCANTPPNLTTPALRRLERWVRGFDR